MKIEQKLEIENRLTSLETTLDELKTNHFPHLQGTVDKILWLIITTLLGIVVHGALTYYQIK